MTLSTLRPTSTVANSGALFGGATAHAVLSDNSDSTGVILDYLELSKVGLTDLTLPAGAVIKNVGPRARMHVSGAAGVASAQMNPSSIVSGEARSIVSSVTLVTTVPTTYSGDLATNWTDAFADAAVYQLAHMGPNSPSSQIYLYELYFDVVYVTQPVVAVDTPTGTLTSTNQPRVSWTDTLDADGGQQAAWEVKIFSAAQYGAGGFSADTSTPTASSGIQSGGEASPLSGQLDEWVVTSVLANATYRAYVRVAQSVNGSFHWSAWDFEGFTINVTPPSVPTLTLTAQSSSGRIKVDVNDVAGSTATQALELQRSVDGGTTWEGVRNSQGSDGFFVGTDMTVYDYEAPNGTTTRYRARALFNYPGTEYSASAWTATGTATWTATDCWIKHPNLPALNLKLTNSMLSYQGHSSAGRLGVFMPVGASLPVVVSDTRFGPTGSLVLALATSVDRLDLDALLATADTLLVQVPGSVEPDRYVKIADHARERAIDKSFAVTTRETLGWVECDAPPDAISGAEWS